MTEDEVREVVSALLGKTASNRGSPKTLMRLLHGRRFPSTFFAVLEPLLYNAYTYKYAIDILGNMKDAPDCVSDAICAAWERSWERNVPQACDCAFPALQKLGGNDHRLLSMVERAIWVDNYGIHKLCVDTLLGIEGGNELLAKWLESEQARHQHHLYRKLTHRIKTHLAQDSRGDPQ